MSKEYIDVLPTNVNQVQAVSYHDGNPLVELVISSSKTSQTIEHIKNFNTMLST